MSQGAAAAAVASAASLKRLLVIGGNGFVGQSVCRAAVSSGKFLSVQSLSRSGAPPRLDDPSLTRVEWLRGDVFDAARREEALDGVDCVVSAVGAFGSNESMERICGDATIAAVETAVSKNVSSFGFVSAAPVGKVNADAWPSSFPLRGYFRGKSRAEAALREAFPRSHLVLRPGFIYGPRAVGSMGVVLPLQYIGEPINFVGTKMGPLSSLIQMVPLVGAECSSMVPVESLAKATVETLSGEMSEGLTLMPDDIRKFD